MERRLSAILSYDVVGYSLAMGQDETGTLETLKFHRRKIIEPLAKQHGGRTIKLLGDGALMEFASVVDAVQFAVRMQVAMAQQNRDIEETRRLLYRVGINVGDVIIDGEDIYGDGVNVAARLEALAEPGGVCVRRNVRNQVRDKLALNFVDLGEVEVKNIVRPVRAFHVVIDHKAEVLAAPSVDGSRKKLPPFAQGAMGVVLALILVFAWALWWPMEPEVEPASVDQMAYPIPEKPSIAVLPFEDLTGNADNDYFANGITRNLITELARFRNLFVIAHNSTAVYADDTVSIRQVSQALGVQYVLVGSVQRSQDDIRINAQLIDSLTGRHVWSERYDRPIADLFKVQDDVTQQIVATLAAHSGLIADAWVKRTERKGTASLRAFDLDLQGWEANQNWTREEFELAASLFEQAIAADPDYARPYANLAMNIVWQVYSKFAPDEELKRALELAKKAVALDDGEAWGYWALGATYLKLEQYEQAVTAYDKALQLNPSDADLLAESAFLFSWVGRPDEAIENVLTAMRLNPRHGDWYRWALGVAYYDARRYADSIEILTSRTSPNLKSNLYLAAAYGQLGLDSEAKLVVEVILDENPESSIELWGRAQPYQDESDLDHYIEGLRRAGLPE